MKTNPPKFPELCLQSSGLGTILAIAADTVAEHTATISEADAITLQTAAITILDELNDMAEQAGGMLYDNPNGTAAGILVTTACAMREIGNLLNNLQYVFARERQNRSNAAKGGTLVKPDAMKGGV